MTLFAENAKDNKCICESFIEKNKRVVELEKKNAELKDNLAYAKAVMRELLDNSSEYARQRAMDFLEAKI